MTEPAGTLWSRLGITGRLVLALTAASAVIFAVVFYTNYRFTAAMVERQVQAHARDVVQGAVRTIDDSLTGVIRDQKNLVAVLERTPRLTRSEVRSLVRSHVVTNDEVFGATIAFERASSPLTGRLFSPYFYKRLNNSIAFADLAQPSYNYLQKPWYQLPRDLKEPVWSEPYFDEGGGNVVMTTYSVPFFRPVQPGGQRLFAGIATSDISIDWLGRRIAGLRLHNNGYAILFSRKGVYLAHPERSLVLKETVFSVAQRMESPILHEVGLAIGRGESGFVRGRNIYGIESWIYYAPVPSTGWSLAVVFPAAAMLADANRASRMIALYCAGGFLLLVLSITLVARSVARPIVEMTGAAERIAAGDLDTVLPQPWIGGEVGALSAAFVRMQGDLREHIARLTETTAAKERMASELSIAHDLQMSILPRELPQLTCLEAAGFCQPAREVGGDLYDAWRLDDGRLFFIIGDVSGKGVPAALYMAITVSLARAIAREQAGPAEVLGRINRELARGNDACMFVTLFCGILDSASGEIRYANAGHNPPLLIGADNRVALLEIKPGLAVGCLDDYAYSEAFCRLDAGATLLLYTDGVTEALDRSGNFFGEQRLCAVAETAASAGSQLIGAVIQAVEGFADGAAQADDITLLAITRRMTL